MVFTYEETSSLEVLKQKHKIDLTKLEHKLKMERLDKMLEIAKAGGVRDG